MSFFAGVYSCSLIAQPNLIPPNTGILHIYIYIYRDTHKYWVGWFSELDSDLAPTWAQEWAPATGISKSTSWHQIRELRVRLLETTRETAGCQWSMFSRFLVGRICQNMPGCGLHYCVGLLLLGLFALLNMVAACLLAIHKKGGQAANMHRCDDMSWPTNGKIRSK